MYDYRATVLKVIDGDTLDLSVDLGFHICQTMRIRLAGVNACELHDPDPKKRAKGEAAREFLRGKLPEGFEVRVFTQKDRTEKYGRYLGEIYPNWSLPGADNPSVNALLLSAGLAVPYDGGPR